MANVTREVTLSQLAGWAERKADELQDLDHRPALELVKADLAASVMAGFQNQHDPDGRPWKPGADPFKRVLYGTKGIMIARVIAGHRAGRVGRNLLEVEIESEIAALHNLGKKKRPQREFLGFGEEGLELAAARVADNAAKKLVEA